MRWLILITLTVCSTACPTKEFALDCFYDRADANGDGRISRHELSTSIYSRLRWWEKAGFALFGGVQQIVNDCDDDGDGYLTKEEAYRMPRSCMETCYKRSTTVELFRCV